MPVKTKYIEILTFQIQTYCEGYYEKDKDH